MANATIEECERMVKKEMSEGKRKAWTVPYVVRPLAPSEWAQLRNSPQEEKQKRKKKLDLKVKDAVPYGRYPCDLKSKGVSWCQVTIQKESGCATASMACTSPCPWK